MTRDENLQDTKARIERARKAIAPETGIDEVTRAYGITLLSVLDSLIAQTYGMTDTALVHVLSQIRFQAREVERMAKYRMVLNRNYTE